MHRVEFHDEADHELKAASRYYENRVEGLGERFLDDIEEAIAKIKIFPMAWPVYEEEYRRYLLNHFPYGLIYRIDSELIFIIAVTHLQRKPGYWKTRESSL